MYRRDGGRDCVSDGAGAAAGACTERPAADRWLAALLWLWYRLHAGLRYSPLTAARQTSPHVRLLSVDIINTPANTPIPFIINFFRWTRTLSGLRIPSRAAKISNILTPFCRAFWGHLPSLHCMFYCKREVLISKLHNIESAACLQSI